MPLKERKPFVFISTFFPNNFGKSPDEFAEAVDATYPAKIMEVAKRLAAGEEIDGKRITDEQRELLLKVLSTVKGVHTPLAHSQISPTEVAFTMH